ncbi:Glucose/sorbosone dehydrogenase [Hirsutella rhossiliensis]|uniref:Glucose/sorbosone dehydrogenase n=1 Tax=Hirsutella rhossiliensis TaxID=111463 RepID=A0A9P8SF39_9HYPO|nr:Glucose/sorbosone dehydrogenase [Hirsutella rhossiliensis]KAH0958626.1 Glucose/sorbosone dehydrogenase [Hirsutella rhossiliensis]
MASLRTAATAALAALIAAAPSSAQSSSDGCPNTLRVVDYAAPVAAPGWAYRLAARGLRRPRSLAFDAAGGLLVVDVGAGVLRLAVEQDRGATCVVLGEARTVVNSTQLTHGLALSTDGKTLYASSASSVVAWPYDPSTGKVTGPNRTVVANLSSSERGEATTRTLLASRKRPGTLVVSRGGLLDDDGDAGARARASGHAQIRAFDVGGLGPDDEAIDFAGGHGRRGNGSVLLGWGLRNAVGVAEHPARGGIWSVENSIDELTRAGRDAHRDNPAEELNFHGRLDGNGAPDRDGGGNYGFPLCFAVWNATALPDAGSLRTGDQFAGPEAAASRVSDEQCSNDYVAPRLVFQAHSSPLDIKFNGDGSRAFISFHGSWNRESPVGYRIAAVAFNNATGEPSAPRDSTNAAVDVLSAPDLASCPDGCFRPVGLAWDASGRLWFSSDTTGEIFVLHQSGDGGDGANVGAPLLAPALAAVRAAVLCAVVVAVFLA